LPLTHRAQEAGKHIAQVLLGSDDVLRVFAAIHAPTPEIPADTVVRQLIHLHAQGDPRIVKYAAAIALCEFHEQIPSGIFQSAMKDLAQFVKGKVYNMFPALVARVKGETEPYLKDHHLMQQDSQIGELAIHYLTLREIR
jgi:hypothetical protein